MKNKMFVFVLTALGANAAMAQSSLTLYGLVDLETGKYDGSQAIRMNTGATSFWGLKGIEDLGGGYRAIFQLEQQFNPNNGTFYNSNSFFSGRSTVGLEGWFGHLAFGRDVNASHYAEVSADPFGQNGLAAGYAARGGISQANGGPGQIDTVRTNNSANYAYTLGSVTVRAQAATRDSAVRGDNIPYSASVVYQDSKLKLAASYIRPQADHARWAYTSGQYDLGFARLYGGYGFGHNGFSQTIHNEMAGLSVPIGPAQAVMTTFSHTASNGQTIQCRSVLGYFYFLSKATSVYADVVYDSQSGRFAYGAAGWQATGTSTNGTGYTVGLRHLF